MFDFEDILAYTIIGLLILISIVGFIKSTVKNREKQKKLLKELEMPSTPPHILETRVKIVKMECYIKKIGVKNPQSIPTFCITVSDGYGEEKTYEITENLYLSLEEGRRGVLATVDGEFFDFYVDTLSDKL